MKADDKVQCACGCVVERSELVKVRKRVGNGTLFSVFCCPIHPDAKIGTVKYRIYNCIVCWHECKVSICAGLACRCKACQRKYHNKIGNERNKARKKKSDGILGYAEKKRMNTRNVQASSERWNCKHRSDCLNDAVDKKKLNVLPCLNCRRYEPQSMSVDFTDATFRHGLESKVL